jgi:hypothetical protein
LCGIGAARVPSAEHEALCIPLLMKCGTPAPSPTPSPTPTGPLGGLAPILGGVTGGASNAAGGVASVVATPDPNAPVMTLPAAQLGGSSLSFTGLKSVTLVTVPLANGSRTPVIKLVADSITITDFLLDVRPAHDSGALVTNSGVMTLRGNVTAYLDSVTGTLLDGTGLSLGVAADPPPGNELPSQLLRVNLGLVGVTANSITLIPSHQEIHN